MPIYRAKVDAGGQFTGVDADTGLFEPTKTGGFRSQVRINSAKFHTTGAVTTWTLTDVDPVDAANMTVLLTDTTDDFHLEGLLLAKEANADTWGLRLVTTGMTADGWFIIDYDAVLTEQ